MDWTARRRIGQYEIAEKLGAGAMGEVYRARDLRLKRDVAIKVLPASVRDDRERAARFKREARAIGSLNHPNVLSVHELCEQEGELFLVTELLEGSNLQELQRWQRLPRGRVLDLVLQLAHGLAAAHDQRIVHRDLKPANLFVTTDGRLKILDFGLARIEEVKEQDSTAAVQTASSAVMGTAAYMAPEQVRGRPADHRSDLFACGVILYEMMAGHRPFEGDSLAEVGFAIIHDEPAPLEDRAVDAVARRCMAKEPRDRFQSAHDFAFCLAALARESSSSRSMPRFALAAWLVVAVAFLASAAVVVTFLTRDRQSAQPAALVSDGSSPPSFTRLTYQRGAIFSARFAPDGRGLLYSGTFSGLPAETYRTELGQPESRALFEDQLLSVSPNGEVAILRGAGKQGFFTWIGTLAIARLSGGGVRELASDVVGADIAADGSLAVSRWGEQDGRPTRQVELPVGTVIYRPEGHVTQLRVTADGKRIALIEHASEVDDAGTVKVIDRSGTVITLGPVWTTIRGIAWEPGEGAVLVAASRGATRTIHRLGLDGSVDELFPQGTSSLTLHDVAADGRLLVAATELRATIWTGSVDSGTDRDVSWFDTSILVDYHFATGRVLFHEWSAATGADYVAYFRDPDAAAVRLGVMTPRALSPDGRLALTAPYPDRNRLDLVPLAAGDFTTLPSPPFDYNMGARFFSDGSRILIKARDDAGKGAWVFDRATGDYSLLARAVWHLESTAPVSPDGENAVLFDTAPFRIDIATGARTPMSGMGYSDAVVGWSADSRYAYVQRSVGSPLPARIDRYDLATDRLEPWRELSPSDRAGDTSVAFVYLDSAGERYAYGLWRELGELYLVER